MASACSRVPWLALALISLACGQAELDKQVVPPAEGGAGGRPAVDIAGAGAGGAVVRTNCAFPEPAAPLEHGPADVTQYTLGSEYTLPVAPADWDGFIGAYDINGDGVSDVVYAA